MSGDWIAQAALVISVVLALLQVRQYFLEAGRIRVRLTAGLLSDESISEVPKWSRFSAIQIRPSPWSREVAILRVSNAGRSPVTIDAPSLDLGSTSLWRFWNRHTVGPMLEDAPGAAKDQRIRLEPFDDRMFVFDIWQILNPGIGDLQIERPVRIRGSIAVAGKMLRRRSLWHGRWLVKQDQFTLRSAEVKVSQIAYASLRRHGRNAQAARVRFVMTAVKIEEEYPLGGTPPTKDDIERLLGNHGETTDQFEFLMISFMTALDLDHFYDSKI